MSAGTARTLAVGAIAPQPWRNGGGTTREIARGPGWRLSLARIDRAGPFSPFPGVRRWLAVVDGGVELRWDDCACALGAGDAPVAFDGDSATHADPGQAHACHVLNLMLAPQREGAGLLRVALRAGDALDANGACAIYVQAGGLGGGDVRAGAGDAILPGEASPSLVAAGDAIVLVARCG